MTDSTEIDDDQVTDSLPEIPTDTATDPPLDDPDADAVECGGAFEDGYDVASLALEVLPRDRPPTECGSCCKQVTFSRDPLSMRGSFDAWGRYLVYATIDTGAGNNTRVILVDLAEETEYIIEERTLEPAEVGVSSDILRFPAIHGSNVYYSRSRSFDTPGDEHAECEIIRFSLVSGVRDVVHSFDVCDIADSCWCPLELKAFGDHLVWNDNRVGMAGGQQIRVLNLVTGVETIVTEPRPVGGISIWSVMVAYDDQYYVPYPTYLYDIETEVTRTLPDGEYDRWDLRIWENLVTWSDTRAGGTHATRTGADIYMMDISTDVETAVCTDPAAQFGSFIFGDIIAWTDTRDDPEHAGDWLLADDWNVYAYRISTGEEMRLTDLPGREEAVEIIDGRVFFWMTDDAGIRDRLFMVDVPPI